MDIDNKGINQLLLSPLFLLEDILGTVVPGAVLVLLLGFKGNNLLRIAWYSSPLGYKMKIAVFLLAAYVIGSALKFPFFMLLPLVRKKPPTETPAWLKKQSPEVRRMITGILGEGAILSSPALMDRLSVNKADAGFHAGTGVALLISAMIPGDGSLRFFELLFGLAMLTIAAWRAKEYQDMVLRSMGIGWITLIGRMTPLQLRLAIAVVRIARGGNSAGASRVVDVAAAAGSGGGQQPAKPA